MSLWLFLCEIYIEKSYYDVMLPNCSFFFKRGDSSTYTTGLVSFILFSYVTIYSCFPGFTKSQ